MYSRHPQIAERWSAEERKGAADFKGLRPGQYARHTGKASEREAMAQGPPTFMAGARPGKLGVAPREKGFAGRDVRAAAVAHVTKKGG